MEARPRRVILMIGDSMGFSHVALAPHRAVGADTRLHMERTPVGGLMRPHSANQMVTDSAAASTAIATAVKTCNGRIDMEVWETLDFTPRDKDPAQISPPAMGPFFVRNRRIPGTDEKSQAFTLKRWRLSEKWREPVSGRYGEWMGNGMFENPTMVPKRVSTLWNSHKRDPARHRCRPGQLQSIVRKQLFTMSLSGKTDFTGPCFGVFMKFYRQGHYTD